MRMIRRLIIRSSMKIIDSMSLSLFNDVFQWQINVGKLQQELSLSMERHQRRKQSIVELKELLKSICRNREKEQREIEEIIGKKKRENCFVGDKFTLIRLILFPSV